MLNSHLIAVQINAPQQLFAENQFHILSYSELLKLIEQKHTARISGSIKMEQMFNNFPMNRLTFIHNSIFVGFHAEYD